MTIKQARKLLGKEARYLTNEEIQRDIRTATLLKNLFFNNLIQSKKHVQSESNR